VTLPPLIVLPPGAHWTQVSGSGRDVRLRFDHNGTAIEFSARRCAEGRLRHAYPVGAHDVELAVPDDAAPHRVTRPLAALAQTILNSDNSCRRVVFAASAGDAAMVSAAEAAGFRYVLDVDVPGAELSLLVAEPSWITELDDDRVPGS
jgi:hypothetical protein